VNVETDKESDKSGAVANLRAALLGEQGVADALRACWYRHPLFASTLLSESVRLRFPPNCDLRLVTAFVARVRSNGPRNSAGFPSREAEAVMRACLGEVVLLEAVDPRVFNYPEISIALTSQLFAEWQPAPAEVHSLFALVERALPEMHVMSPHLEADEDQWFAAGMHISPFAAPDAGLAPPQSADG
jgi:hypothetical protein